MGTVNLTINNTAVRVEAGTTIAAAVFIAETDLFRRSISGEVRKPLCGMGICYECRVEINGIKQQKSCQTLVEEGMNILTDE